MAKFEGNRRCKAGVGAGGSVLPEGADVPLTPSETAMLAVAESRNRSDVNLHKRTQT
jgi:hypothetical protein